MSTQRYCIVIASIVASLALISTIAQSADTMNPADVSATNYTTAHLAAKKVSPEEACKFIELAKSSAVNFKLKTGKIISVPLDQACVAPEESKNQQLINLCAMRELEKTNQVSMYCKARQTATTASKASRAQFYIDTAASFICLSEYLAKKTYINQPAVLAAEAGKRPLICGTVAIGAAATEVITSIKMLKDVNNTAGVGKYKVVQNDDGTNEVKDQSQDDTAHSTRLIQNIASLGVTPITLITAVKAMGGSKKPLKFSEAQYQAKIMNSKAATLETREAAAAKVATLNQDPGMREWGKKTVNQALYLSGIFGALAAGRGLNTFNAAKIAKDSDDIIVKIFEQSTSSKVATKDSGEKNEKIGDEEEDETKQGIGTQETKKADNAVIDGNLVVSNSASPSGFTGNGKVEGAASTNILPKNSGLAKKASELATRAMKLEDSGRTSAEALDDLSRQALASAGLPFSAASTEFNNAKNILADSVEPGSAGSIASHGGKSGAATAAADTSTTEFGADALEAIEIATRSPATASSEDEFHTGTKLSIFEIVTNRYQATPVR